VLVTRYWFGNGVLKIKISERFRRHGDLTACPCVACPRAIAACEQAVSAKKEELSLAIACPLSFTVIMNGRGMPVVIRASAWTRRARWLRGWAGRIDFDPERSLRRARFSADKPSRVAGHDQDDSEPFSSAVIAVFVSAVFWTSTWMRMAGNQRTGSVGPKIWLAITRKFITRVHCRIDRLLVDSGVSSMTALYGRRPRSR